MSSDAEYTVLKNSPLMLIKIRDFFIIPMLAACIYGGWAAYVNLEHSASVALRAGLGQGIYAFMSTLLVTEMAKRAFRFFGCGYKAILFSFIATFLLMLAIPCIVHAWLMTPDTLEAILPGLLWGSIYILLTLIFLYRKEQMELDAKQI